MRPVQDDQMYDDLASGEWGSGNDIHLPDSDHANAPRIAQSGIARSGRERSGRARSGRARSVDGFSGDGESGDAVTNATIFGGAKARRRIRQCRFMRYWRSHSLKYFVGLICMALCGLVLVLPSPYVIESPGPTQDVLAKVDGKPIISVTGAETYKSKGKLLLTTVNAQGVPGYPALGVESLVAVFDPKADLLPKEAVFPIGQTSRQYEQRSAKQMEGSQDSASVAALAYAAGLGLDTQSVKVSMHVDDIGGPSAGMMYALGTLDKLTSADETGGKVIAGTGTIDDKGKVGKIGGIKLKMLGAKRDGATWFLAPASNCDEVVGHVPQGLRDVKVSTLDEAYKALAAIGKGQADSLPHCAI